MKLQVGTEFNILENGEKYYRIVTFDNGYYKAMDKDGIVICRKLTLKELNNYYSDFKIEIISKQRISEISREEIGKVVAYELMKQEQMINQYTLKMIENAVFNLLVEKEIISK